MFIKIKYHDVEKNESGNVTDITNTIEHVYDCDHFALFQSSACGSDDDEPDMNLSIQKIGLGRCLFDETVTFPKNCDIQVTDVFVMNGEGKTIDKYNY